jgi:hypothetical protein
MSVHARTVVRDWTIAFGVVGFSTLFRAPIARLQLEITFFYENFGRVAKSASEVVREVTRLRGPLSWWRNAFEMTVRYGVPAANIFVLNDCLLKLNNVNANENFGLSLGAKMLAGGSAGAIGTALSAPVLKLFYTLRAAPSHVTSNMLWLNGVGLYRSGQLGFFYQLQELNPWASNVGVVGVASTWLVASAVHVAATPISFPFDTVRRRLSLDLEREQGKDARYSSFFDCFRKIIAKEGVRGLTRGMSSDIRSRIVSQSFILMAYDRVKKSFDFH